MESESSASRGIEALRTVRRTVLGGPAPLLESTSAALEYLVGLRRWVGITGRVAQAGLLLAARIWLSQAIFVHQLMMMMHAAEFAGAPPVEAALTRSVAPLFLAMGLLTGPLTLILVLGIGLDEGGSHSTAVQTILLIWLLAGGTGPLSVDCLLRSDLARVPIWTVRAFSRLYARSDHVADIALSLGTRLCFALAIAVGTGSAMWPAPIAGEFLTAPSWTLLLCWALILGVATRPVALLLCGLAPPIVLSDVVPDQLEVMVLLLLIAAKGAGRLSLDDLLARWADVSLRVRGWADETIPHVVVVGGGFGGVAAVRALRRTACRITLVDRHNHYLFQPRLYQVATAALSPGDIAIPIRSVVRGQQNVVVRLGEEIGVDNVARQVVLANGHIPFDYLVLATGAQHSYFGRDDWSSHALGLKSIGNATVMRSWMFRAFEQAESEADRAMRLACLTFVVVGGPTGVELAGALAELARTGLDRECRVIDPTTTRVILVQSAPRVLPTFSSQLSAQADLSLRELGVEVLTGAKVTHIDQEGVEIDGERIAARSAFWAAGVAASPASKWPGRTADRSGRVLVNGDLSVPDCLGVFAIGDTAASNGWAGTTVLDLAPAAKQQRRHVAHVIQAAIKGHPWPGTFKYRHYGNLATIGRLAAVVQSRWFRLWGAPAWWFWGIAHVLLLAGGRYRATVVLNWLWADLTYRRSTRLITNSVDA